MKPPPQTEPIFFVRFGPFSAVSLVDLLSMAQEETAMSAQLSRRDPVFDQAALAQDRSWDSSQKSLSELSVPFASRDRGVLPLTVTK